MRERHTDQFGIEEVIPYYASQNADVSAIMAARAVTMSARLTASEIDKNLDDIKRNGSLASPTLRHSTLPQNGAAVRAHYAKLAPGSPEVTMIGDFLSTLTDDQLQTAFGIGAAAVTNLRTNKLTPSADLAAQLRAATGA